MYKMVNMSITGKVNKESTRYVVCTVLFRTPTFELALFCCIFCLSVSHQGELAWWEVCPERPSNSVFN